MHYKIVLNYLFQFEGGSLSYLEVSYKLLSHVNIRIFIKLRNITDL